MSTSHPRDIPEAVVAAFKRALTDLGIPEHPGGRCPPECGGDCARWADAVEARAYDLLGMGAPPQWVTPTAYEFLSPASPAPVTGVVRRAKQRRWNNRAERLEWLLTQQRAGMDWGGDQQAPAPRGTG